MGTLIFKWRYIAAISILLTLFLSAVACGEADQTTSTPNPVAAAATSTTAPVPPTSTVAPIATFVVIEVTPAPIPTETPIPTLTPVPPTPTPFVDLEALNDVGPQRLFPDSLLGSSDRLERDVAAEIWDAFLSDTRISGELSGPNVLDLCADHTGTWVFGSDIELRPLTGMTFEWEVQTSPAGRWNEPKLVMTSDEFASLTYGAHLIHITSDDSLYTVLQPIGGYRPVSEGHEQASIFTLNGNDYSYEFSETTDTVCAS